MKGEACLKIKQICKAFGPQQVLNRASFEARQGDCLLLLGANGAGKSTLLRILAGLSRADSGEIELDGKLLKHRAPQSTGYLGHQCQLYSQLTVLENLKLSASLTGIEFKGETLSAFDLNDISSKKVSELSKGQQARAGLCRALMHNPRFVFLDEPTSALDESATLLLKSWIGSHPETLIIMATHDIRRVGDIANRILILKGGEITERAVVGESIELIVNSYLEAAIR